MDSKGHGRMHLPTEPPVRPWFRWLVGAAAALVMTWGGYWALATYELSRSECSNEVLQEAASPDGGFTATAFERNCGATAPFARIVGVRSPRDQFDGDQRDQWVFVAQGQPAIQLTWTEPGHLTIKYGGGSRVVRKAVTWYGVNLSYE
jgi:hypothetical protein